MSGKSGLVTLLVSFYFSSPLESWCTSLFRHFAAIHQQNTKEIVSARKHYFINQQNKNLTDRAALSVNIFCGLITRSSFLAPIKILQRNQWTQVFKLQKKYKKLINSKLSPNREKTCQQWPSFRKHFPHHQNQPLVDNHGTRTNKFHQPFTLIMFPKPCFLSNLLRRG